LLSMYRDDETILRTWYQLGSYDTNTRNRASQQKWVTMNQDLCALWVPWNIDPGEPRTQDTRRSTQIGSSLKWKQSVSYSQINGSVENCAQGAWEPSDLSSKESTQRETMSEPISCDKAER
jgi:hypothetical protein